MTSEINSANLRKIQQRLDAMQNQIDALEIEVDVAKDYAWVQAALIEELLNLMPADYADDVAKHLLTKRLEFEHATAGDPDNPARLYMDAWIACFEQAGNIDYT